MRASARPSARNVPWQTQGPGATPPAPCSRAQRPAKARSPPGHLRPRRAADVAAAVDGIVWTEQHAPAPVARAAAARLQQQAPRLPPQHAGELQQQLLQRSAGQAQQQQQQQQQQRAQWEQGPGNAPLQDAPQQHHAQLQQQQQQLQQQRQQQRQRQRCHWAAEQSSSSDAAGRCSTAAQQRGARKSPPPVRLQPCQRGASLELVTAVSRCLHKGRSVLLPAGSGMQAVRGLSALASARTLMLSRSSATGLAFQPSFSSAAAPDREPHSRQAPEAASYTGQQHQHQQHAGGGGRRGIMLFVAGLPEAQLRRFDQSPLVAARHGSAARLARAAFARLCRQGFTSVRAAGPDAVRVALHAATETRRKLLGCGLDVAVVPATEFVDTDTLAGPEQQQQQFAYDGDDLGEGAFGDDGARQFVRVTVLHLVRCELQQPGKLLPWPVPAEQLPATRWPQQQVLSLARQPPVQQQEPGAPSSVQWGVPTPSAAQATTDGTAVVRDASVPACAPDSPSSPGRVDAPGPTELAPLVHAVALSAVGRPARDDGARTPAAPQEGDDDVGAKLRVLQLPGHGAGGGVLARQPGALLLQKQQRRGKRQLVAAAQAAGGGLGGGGGMSGS